MKTYVVAISDYMGDNGSMSFMDAVDDETALKKILYWDNRDDPSTEWKGFLQDAIDDNGDGQPWMMVACVDDKQTIFGG